MGMALSVYGFLGKFGIHGLLMCKIRMIYAGPFIGEFGWELMCWQAHLRHLSRQGAEIVVGVHPNHYALYDDFARGFYPFVSTLKPNAMTAEGADWDNYRSLVPEGFEWLRPVDVTLENRGGCFVTVPQQHRSFADPSEPKRYDLCIHARNRTTNGERNWQHWEKFMRRITPIWKVVSIGTPKEALAYNRGHDFRGLPLHDVITVMNQSKLVLGPSSGPMHLAALCEVPHLVWSGSPKDQARYAEVWNPFGTKNVLLDTWQPTVDEVMEWTHALINRKP